MSKGQPVEVLIKKVLKFLKLREEAISTIMGAVVIVMIGVLTLNYFRTTAQNNIGQVPDESEVVTTTAPTPSEDSLKLSPTPNVHKVSRGEGLWQIAKKYYGDGYKYVEIIKANSLKNTVLFVGQELKIPAIALKEVAKVENVQSEAKTVVTAKVFQAKTIEIGEYTTQKGDTYWTIAVRAYGDGFAWPKIYWANRKVFANPDVIHANVKITIPKLFE